MLERRLPAASPDPLFVRPDQMIKRKSMACLSATPLVLFQTALFVADFDQDQENACGA
jgi:hypothetical protein